MLNANEFYFKRYLFLSAWVKDSAAILSQIQQHLKRVVMHLKWWENIYDRYAKNFLKKIASETMYNMHPVDKQLMFKTQTWVKPSLVHAEQSKILQVPSVIVDIFNTDRQDWLCVYVNVHSLAISFFIWCLTHWLVGDSGQPDSVCHHE